MEKIACKECTFSDCHGCNMYRLERMLMSGKLDALMDENRAIKMDADARPVEWIPVTERLPNGEAERYLVATPLMALGLWVSICYYADNLEEVDEYDFKGENHSGFYGSGDDYGYYERSGVKYWMPLPEPPKEE